MNSVMNWNAILLEASRRDFTPGNPMGQQPGPIRTSWAMAIVHLAIHDAVALRNKPGAAYLNKKQWPHGIPQLSGNVDDIIAGAAVTTLTAMYPADKARFDAAGAGAGQAGFKEGVLVGKAVLACRVDDGSGAPLTEPQPVNPGYGHHRADPYAFTQPRLGTHWGQVKRFTGSNHEQLDAFPGTNDPTDFLADAGFRADYIEVRDHGGAKRAARTAAQERIGVFWGYDGAANLGVPPRLYNQIAREIVMSKAPGLNVARTAELFAMINVAMADGGIDAWYWKYVYDLWRPVVAIREEAGTEGDRFWAPLGMPQTNGKPATLTPNFPAYPSGHATFGAALMQTLRLTFNGGSGPLTVQDVLDVESGTSTPIAKEAFTFTSDELDGKAMDPDGSVRTKVPVEFPNFATAVWENSISRVYLGVHWRFDGLPRNAAAKVGGVPLGLAVGQKTHAFFNNAPSLGGP